MNCSTAFNRSVRCCVGVGLLLGTFWSSAWGQEVSIQASFKPDSAYPQLNQFKNDTPSSGYCAIYPGQCTNNRMFSLQVPIQFDSSAPIAADHGDVRQGAMIKAPVLWRELTVIHESTGEPETVKVRIVGVGSRYETEDVISLVGGGGDDYRLAHNQLWGLSWVNAPSPCQYSGVGAYSNTTYRFFWKTPTDGICQKQAKFNVPWLRYEHLDFAYELVTPNPLGMSSGKYRGSLTYTVGPNSDFDMGDVMVPNSSTLSLNFTLDVQHTLKVEVPPGGNQVELVPQGGWQSWLTQGRKPTRLFRDQTFNISASSRFKMKLECSLYNGDGCGLRDTVTEDNRAPLRVSVSLPHGLTDAGGQPVSRRLLTWKEDLMFQPGFYVDRKPGTLHFEVPPEAMAYMIEPGQSRQYRARVTVIWDSDI